MFIINIPQFDRASGLYIINKTDLEFMEKQES